MLGRGRLFAVERCSPFLFFFAPDLIKSLNRVPTCQLLHDKFLILNCWRLFFFSKSLVPLEHRGFRAFILLLLLSFVSCCRWGPSFLPCCSLVFLPTTPFLTGAFYFFPCLVQDAFLFFHFFMKLWPQEQTNTLLVVCDTRVDNYTLVLCPLGAYE